MTSCVPCASSVESQACAIARILCGAGCAVVSPRRGGVFVIPRKREGAERQKARPFSSAAPLRRRGRPSALHLRLCIASRWARGTGPGTVLPGADGAPRLRIQATFAALRPCRVQPSKAAGLCAGGRRPKASRGRGYEPHPQAPRPAAPGCPVPAPKGFTARSPAALPFPLLHHRNVSRRRPQPEQGEGGVADDWGGNMTKFLVIST
jgi:hypothetical protein